MLFSAVIFICELAESNIQIKMCLWSEQKWRKKTNKHTNKRNYSRKFCHANEEDIFVRWCVSVSVSQYMYNGNISLLSLFLHHYAHLHHSPDIKRFVNSRYISHAREPGGLLQLTQKFNWKIHSTCSYQARTVSGCSEFFNFQFTRVKSQMRLHVSFLLRCGRRVALFFLFPFLFQFRVFNLTLLDFVMVSSTCTYGVNMLCSRNVLRMYSLVLPREMFHLFSTQG